MNEQAIHILLIEDNKGYAELIRRALSQRAENIRLVWAENLREARRCLGQSSFDLIIADLILPDGRGIELLQSQEPALAIPMVVMTGHGDEQAAVEAIKAGALDYIVKSPEILDDVPHIVERTLREWENITERKRAEDAVVRGKEQWEKTFNVIPDLITITDTEHRIVQVNQAVADRLGLTPEQCVGKTCYSLIHRLDEPPSFCPHVQLLKDGQEHTADVYEVNLKGDFSVSVSPLVDADGKLIGSVHVAHDITERKRAEAALRESEEKFKGIFEFAADAMHLLDGDRFIANNEKAVRMYGYGDKKQMLGMTPMDISPERQPDGQLSRNKAIKYIEEALTGKPQRFYWKHKRVDTGELFDAEVMLCRLVLGDKTYLLASGRDITEHKRAEEALKESEENYRVIFESSKNAIFIADAEGRFTDVNNGTETLTGYSKQELKQMSIPDLYEAGDLHAYQRYFDRIMAGEAVTSEADILRKDDTKVPTEFSNNRIFIRGVPFMRTVAQDISERKRAQEIQRQHEAELAHAARLSTMGEMASGLAHELNQPLCAITSSAEGCRHMIQSAGATDNTREIMGGMTEVVQQANRAGEIIRRMRNFVRKQEPRRSSVNLNEIVQESIKLLGTEAARHEITIRVKLVDGIPMMQADPIQIEQVIFNLLRNGIEAMEHTEKFKRNLTVHTALSNDGCVEVAVIDTGEGFAQENAEQIFESFYTTKPQGMGIGLSISRSIIEGHGGHLWATSNPQGGTTFRFTLPMKEV